MQETLAGGLRLAGLSMRMGLALFMARFMSFTDIGVFALLVGLTGLLPGAAGLGLAYFVNREIIGMESGRALVLARDRLIVTAFCGALAAIAFAVVARSNLVILPANLWVCGALIILEMIGFDLHLLLIARHRTTTANFLLFLRSAFWIPVFMTAGYAIPSLLNIKGLTAIWLGGLLLYAAITAIVLRRALLNPSLWTTSFDSRWLKKTLPGSMTIWLSDFALALGQYIDRFIISSVVGIAAVGVYYFYFSIANAAFLVVQSATTQPYMPKLRQAFNSQCDQFTAEVDRYFKKITLSGCVIFFMVGCGTFILVSLLSRQELSESLPVIVILLVGMMGRTVYDYLAIIDYITERDKRFVGFNISSFVVTVAAVAVAAKMLGVVGAALGVAAAMISFAGTRWWLWRIERRRLNVGAAA